MATVRQLTALDETFLVTPRPGRGVCTMCFNLIKDHDRCYSCAHGGDTLAGMLPVSYSIGHEQLHHALASYKRTGGRVSRHLAVELAAMLWRFLDRHEHCLAGAAGIGRFELVTTVPSTDLIRDQEHPLRVVVGELLGLTRDRYENLLHRTQATIEGRSFDRRKFAAARPLAGESVLLVDDTWTTGANAQSAAAALQAAGAGRVAALVIGRHVNREWGENNRHLQGLPPFDWDVCALCAEPQTTHP
jgi:predicted amidophosphoribosyltransferase